MWLLNITWYVEQKVTMESCTAGATVLAGRDMMSQDTSD
jgi:hypothetical protein